MCDLDDFTEDSFLTWDSTVFPITLSCTHSMCIFSFDLVHSSSLSLPNSFIHFFPSFLLHILQALSLLIPFVICTFIYSPFFSEQYVLTSLSTFLNSWSWLNSTLNFCWVLVAFVSPFIKQISSGKKKNHCPPQIDPTEASAIYLLPAFFSVTVRISYQD